MSAVSMNVGTLTLAGAVQLADAAEAEASARGLAVCIAVMDQAAHLLLFRRMDGAALVSVDVAMGKARTAALMKTTARFFEEMIDGGHPSLLSVGTLMPLRGGEPVAAGGAVIGAVGVSGAAGEVDEAIAQAAVAAFQTEFA